MKHKPTTPPSGPSGVSSPRKPPTGGGGQGDPNRLHLDVSDEATRQRALELAVEWTCRHRWPDSAGTLVTVAETFRAYLADGTVPEAPQ
ncbi:hypothetical protein J1770_gp59 [Gordonia phage EMoore]|uniref:Uncharacterized protein n=1 Tax=Gordonia phage EMoore TaxID=2656534 RepID=A0A649VV21_9CAUD|nr:hypothetical protein J1770_gp59 [Gordonia phage EMoore]QGJ95845.1 hypothetical protein SEA_EMOORE_59 [Gordonia phage EMoore]